MAATPYNEMAVNGVLSLWLHQRVSELQLAGMRSVRQPRFDRILSGSSLPTTHC